MTNIAAVNLAVILIVAQARAETVARLPDHRVEWRVREPAATGHGLEDRSSA